VQQVPGSNFFCFVEWLAELWQATVAENKGQVALKVEQLGGSHPSSLGGKEQHSMFVKKESWYEMIMQEALEA
jgi:hypothetical protein